MLAPCGYYSYRSEDVIKPTRDVSQRSASKETQCVRAVIDCLQLVVLLATLFAVIVIAVDCFLKQRFHMTDFYVPALMADNVTEMYSFLTAYGYNRSNVAF